jgi:hypothetical protein
MCVFVCDVQKRKRQTPLVLYVLHAHMHLLISHTHTYLRSARLTLLSESWESHMHSQSARTLSRESHYGSADYHLFGLLPNTPRWMLIQLWEFHLHNKKERARAAQHKAHHGDVITNRFEKKKLKHAVGRAIFRLCGERKLLLLSYKQRLCDLKLFGHGTRAHVLIVSSIFKLFCRFEI